MIRAEQSRAGIQRWRFVLLPGIESVFDWIKASVYSFQRNSSHLLYYHSFLHSPFNFMFSKIQSCKILVISDEHLPAGSI